ncbi:transcriptional regulator [Enterococcus florum]|uniref:Transcriptional regulator n=1 Tax=Enterococcus florum TaxID=2480627 RepID=A0A4P5P5G3_9ENTE|nr:Spx/MgsR family RNA polymerase-binding regulatory protein [Enterococcus florum]GCF93075.1 transcriptional regulator [Enterococcus florum]
MIQLYGMPNCISCKKASTWLKKKGLAFQERDISVEPLTEEELKHILSLSEISIEEIISLRSKVYEKLTIDFDHLSFRELLDYFKEQPNLLRQPILIDSLRLQIGFNEEEIQQFIPQEIQYTLREDSDKNLVLFRPETDY